MMMSSVLPVPSMQLARSLPVSLDALPSLSAFELFQSQLESTTEASLDAIKRLTVVAYAMGPHETSHKLIPYLAHTVLNNNNNNPTNASSTSDEFLYLLGQQLVTLLPFCGAAAHADILSMVEKLAAVEETVVRDQAVLIVEEFMSTSNNTSTANGTTTTQLVAMVKRLASADWFTAKVSAAGMMACIYQKSQAKELLTLYKELVQDETPMVRRAAAKHLGAVLHQAQSNDYVLQTLPVLLQDEQDSVRLLAAASMASMGVWYGEQAPQWTAQHLLPLVKDAATDLSWRVRHNLAKHFSDVATNLGIQSDGRKYANEISLVMACFVSLLTDNEAEVRASATTHLARMVAWGGPSQFSAHLAPLLAALADDVVMEVRSKCALAIMDAAHGGTLEDAVILQHFGPLLESFLQDEFHEVQLQVLTNLHKIAHLLPGLAGVVTALLHMAKATNWRVREAVAKLLPHLAEARGTDFFATVLLEPAWLTLLLDPVAQVRSAIVSGMPLLVQVAGEDWILSNLLPQHVRIYNSHSHSYLIRMTLLRAHVEMAIPCQPGGPLWNDAILQILRGLSDKVANVRMMAARGLARVIELGDGGDPHVVQAQIRPAIEKRVHEEEDLDCRRACQLVLEQIQ